MRVLTPVAADDVTASHMSRAAVAVACSLVTYTFPFAAAAHHARASGDRSMPDSQQGVSGASPPRRSFTLSALGIAASDGASEPIVSQQLLQTLTEDAWSKDANYGSGLVAGKHCLVLNAPCPLVSLDSLVVSGLSVPE